MRLIFGLLMFVFSSSLWATCRVHVTLDSHFSPTTWRSVFYDLHNKGYIGESDRKKATHFFELRYIVNPNGDWSQRYIEIVMVSSEGRLLYSDGALSPEYINNRNRLARYLVSKMPNCLD